jgi:hypothetical protein
MQEISYPVTYDVQRPEKYNRLTVLFRIILAIPQVILVGDVGYHYAPLAFSISSDSSQSVTPVLFTGILTAVLGFLVFLAWWAILFTARFPSSFQPFCISIFKWRQNVQAYLNLQTDGYPPFGFDRPYELNVAVTPDATHNRLTSFFRWFMAIPHFIVLFFLMIGQAFVSIVAWFAILFTGEYPAGMYRFSVGVSRWLARVEAYTYLFVDQYPPFSLEANPGSADVQPRTT